MGAPQGVRGQPYAVTQRMVESIPEDSMPPLGASLRLCTEFPVLYFLYITSSRWPQKRQASVSSTSTSNAHRLAEPTHALCKEAMFPLLADTARTRLATPEGMLRHRAVMQQTTSPRQLHVPGIAPFLSTGIIAEKIRSTSCEGNAKLLTPHRCVDRRWMGAMCLNRGACCATFSQAGSPLDSAASYSYTLGVSLNRRSKKLLRRASLNGHDGPSDHENFIG
jgi:hypothetical protein